MTSPKVLLFNTTMWPYTIRFGNTTVLLAQNAHLTTSGTDLLGFVYFKTKQKNVTLHFTITINQDGVEVSDKYQVISQYSKENVPQSYSKLIEDVDYIFGIQNPTEGDRNRNPDISYTTQN